MVRGLNRIMLIGNLGNDPEYKPLPDGKGHTNASLAVNERVYNGRTGEHEERTEWFRLTLFGPQAEAFAQYGYRGRPCYVEGPLRTRKYAGRDGAERIVVEVHVRQFLMLGDRNDEQRDVHDMPRPATPGKPERPEWGDVIFEEQEWPDG